MLNLKEMNSENSRIIILSMIKELFKHSYSIVISAEVLTSIQTK